MTLDFAQLVSASPEFPYHPYFCKISVHLSTVLSLQPYLNLHPEITIPFYMTSTWTDMSPMLMECTYIQVFVFVLN